RPQRRARAVAAVNRRLLVLGDGLPEGAHLGLDAGDDLRAARVLVDLQMVAADQARDRAPRRADAGELVLKLKLDVRRRLVAPLPAMDQPIRDLRLKDAGHAIGWRHSHD